MPCFDVASEVDLHELANAVDQSNRELAQRFDFRDTGAKFELDEHTVTLHAQVEFQLKQMLEVLKLKLGKRGIDVTCLDVKDAETNLAAARQQGRAAPRHRSRDGQEDLEAHEGFEAQGAKRDSGREGAHHRQAARRSASRNRAAEEDAIRPAATVRKFSRLADRRDSESVTIERHP